MEVGDISTWERTFTLDDVAQFAQISGDQGRHHMETDAQGRVLVQGLLTATLPTKLGGDIDFIAREMVFEFLRPVFTGDAIRCQNTVTSVEKQEKQTRMEISCICRNQAGKEVLTCRIRGLVRK
jgi:3-hydroxybutyryl-CoA dehydratase